MGGADDDDAVGDDGGGVQADLSPDRIDLLIESLLQIDDPVGPESHNPLTGRRVERDELVAWRDVENLPGPAIVPVRETAARKPAGRGLTALAFIDSMHPQELAGLRGRGDDGTSGAGRCEEGAANHERCRLEV